ncbi:endosomal trafficking protein RME-8 [Trypanosoma theileri]|uniref:Endosomal trafficking protein RME-8 n=1 Tax=Trypanosoma theileri TaxID=67003 RepID=A0A1X0P2D1_9TRYP|nr:endosomal trafficking protein RME-8 [Trypanosoma theileri]ORC90853.1 endosomal trafficking protein RME-8 [Trypanosoma theileri]
MNTKETGVPRIVNRETGARGGSFEEYTSRHTVIKNSWKGKYMRIFCIGNRHIATINPQSIFYVTNRWDYQHHLVDVVPTANSLTDFSLITGKIAKSETLHFHCNTAMERAELLTDVQRNRALFDPQYPSHASDHVYAARKYCSDEEYRDCHLRITTVAVEQLDAGGRVVGEYLFMNLKGLSAVADRPRSLVLLHGPQLRLHLYETDDPQRVAKAIADAARRFVGLPPPAAARPLAARQFDADRLGVPRHALAPLAEFPAEKCTRKHQQRLPRLLATTEECLLEMDPATYNTTSLSFFADIYALVRSEEDEQRFMIQYKEPSITKVYTSPVRDALLAHLLHCCRAVQNLNVSVVVKNLDRGKRAAPFRVLLSEEIESTLLNCLIDPLKGGGHVAMTYLEVVEFFNANIEFSGLRFTENRDGLFAENREKMIFEALMALLNNFPISDDPIVIVQQFYALRRLCVTRIGFSSAAIVPSLIKTIEYVSMNALKVNNLAVSHAVIDLLCVLMTPHHNHYELIHEKMNKNRILKHERLVKELMMMLHNYTISESASLVVLSLLDFFVYALCPPYCETTEAEVFTYVMKNMVDINGKDLFTLMQHNCNAISYSAGQIIRVIMEEGTKEQFTAMQDASLTEGGILGQLYLATFSNNRELRDIARQLIAYWTYQNTNMQDLMRSIFPPALLLFLQSKDEPPEDEMEKERKRSVVAMTNTFWESKIGWFKKCFHPSKTLPKGTNYNPSFAHEEKDYVRPREVRVRPTLNWPMLFYQLKQDHMRPDLIWNHTTREELRGALEGEMQALKLGRGIRTEVPIAWNYREFEVRYPSLSDELKIGRHYPRLLFEVKNPVIARPREFFNDMYHRFLLTQEHKTKLDCLHGMTILYEYYANDIGQFNDLEYIMKMLEATLDPIFRDRLLKFIKEILRDRHNVKLFLDCDGLKQLVDLVTIAHLHLDRPQLHNPTNAIESSGLSVELQDQEKEWYYTKNGIKQDPVSYTRLKELYVEKEINDETKVWAQGLNGWKEFKDVPQLRWGIVTNKSNKLLTFSEVSCIILDIFLLVCTYYPSKDVNGAIMQPLPRVKRFLSSPQVLPHIVQLLLTFDPSICSRVHSLLYVIMEDNPLISRFFLTGVFFFSLMYTGSDVLPMCRLLYLSHSRQAFQFQHENDIIRNSFLSTLLPPALVCYLANHGPESFADVLLGEYETPEAIWGREMRRSLVETISRHISDFTPRLLCNNRAIYQYCPIVGVMYEPLRNELFCSQYYLRHFCDELHYPNWPVSDPVALLCEVLAAWRRELDKQPSPLTREGCMQELEINSQESHLTPQIVRKAYFKLAALYHPDKNPDGREKFERIQIAYEFLVSDKVDSDEPNPSNIALLLRTQSILFRRFGTIMSQYKYAGYGLLLKLIRGEYEDSEMLRKDVVLMEPATELCYFTVQNVPLNADELQEEGGIELLSNVLQRCFEGITPNSTDDLNQVKIAKHCIHTFRVAAEFSDCRHHIVNNPIISHLVAKGIAYENSVALSRACIQACQSFCVDETLQECLLKEGALWHLMLFLFRYDYTLNESGVEMQEEHHKQLFANRAAVYALQAIYALVGIQPSNDYPKTKPNTEMIHMLQKLLTPYIVQKMRLLPHNEEEILKLINSNHNTPYMLWNNNCRRELQEMLTINSEKCRDSGMFSENLPVYTDNSFSYSAHKEELIVGGIFVRLYNEQPTFPIEDPAAFCTAMIKFLKYKLNNDSSTGVFLVVEAMKNILIAYPNSDVTTTIMQSVDLLLKLFSYNDNTLVLKTSELLEKVSHHLNCLEAIGKCNMAVTEVILAIHRCGEVVESNCLAFLRVALSNRGVVEQALDRGLYAVLLRILGTSLLQECKEDVCTCLAKAFSDKLCGPKLFLRTSKLIPSVFLEMMKESPVNACQLLNTWQETPELVWNKERKQRFVELCIACESDIVELLQHDPTAYWKIPENILAESGEELQLGGVYLKLYLSQPGWNVRKPKEFLLSLLEKFVTECGKPEENINTEMIVLIADAGLRLLQTSPVLTDHLVSLGYAQKLFELLESNQKVVAENALKWVHEECASRICVESLAGFDPVASLLAYMKAGLPQLPLLMDTMERLLSRSSERANMIRLALQNQLPQHLLELLEAGVTPQTCGDQPPAAVRALIIKVLKAMNSVEDPLYGPRLKSILAESKVWSKYKDQSHDLFLSNIHFGGYIEGGPQQRQQQLFISLSDPSTQDVTNDSGPPPV